MCRLLFNLTPIATFFISLLASGALNADDATTVAEVIDQHVQARLQSDGLARAEQADDAEFLRRIFLDLHGVVPSAERTITLDSRLRGNDVTEQARAFLALQ